LILPYDAANSARRAGSIARLPAVLVRMPTPYRHMTPTNLQSRAMSWRCP
jgi:hypothetical protein